MRAYRTTLHWVDRGEMYYRWTLVAFGHEWSVTVGLRGWRPFKAYGLRVPS